MFVTYDGKRAADIAVSRYAVRHLVAAEVSREHGAFDILLHGRNIDNSRCACLFRLTHRSLRATRTALIDLRVGRRPRSSQGKLRTP